MSEKMATVIGWMGLIYLIAVALMALLHLTLRVLGVL